MMDVNDNHDGQSAVSAEDMLLRQLLHLKSYERADSARMVRNRQNIMRRVREANGRNYWSLADLLEVNIPWFFAEPRYGIALLFVVFATLQFWGVNAGKPINDKSSIYMNGDGLVLMEHSTPAFSTNAISYPQLPENLSLFADQHGDTGIKFVGRIEPKN